MKEQFSAINNNAEWESQMMYAEIHRNQILQAEKAQKANIQENHNIKTPRKKKLKRAVAKVALAASLTGGFGALYNYAENNSTVNDSISQINFNETSRQNLDTNPDNLGEYKLIAETEGVNYIVGLKPEDAIRTNDTDHTPIYDPELNPTHNALAQNNDSKTQFFEIKEGPIYETPNGRIAVKSENLTENMSGEKTGIKFELDSDEWSVVDVSPNDLRVVKDFNPHE